jgi:hypothetical protein
VIAQFEEEDMSPNMARAIALIFAMTVVMLIAQSLASMIGGMR